jgi:hypothetical protein
MKIRLAMLLAASFTLLACQSPEARRTRGGGPGADPGNRPATVKMHEGSRPYWKTPVDVPGQAVPLDAARHAQRLSQP